MSKRVVVIGGGVVGLCSAYSLGKKGFEVILVDPGEGPSTSTVNAGMIVPSHIIPLAAPGMVGLGVRMMLRPRSPLRIRPRLDREFIRWGLRFARSCTKEHVERSKRLLIQLNGASKQAYLDFQAELDGFHVEQRGLLMVAKEESTLEEESRVAAQVRELDLPATVLTPAEIAELEPGIRIDSVGGVHYPADCHFSPPVFMTALRQKLAGNGVRFETARAQMLGMDGLHTTSGCLEADTYVVAAGVWSNSLIRTLGMVLPLQPGKGYSFNVEDPPERPSICSILIEGRIAVTPMPAGMRFGGTMEIGPTNNGINQRRVQAIRDTIPDYYPAFREFDIRSRPVGVGLRPCSPDGLPYIGRLSRREDVIVATGHAMMGMSLGPITGRLVAQLAAGEEPEIDLGLLAPDRFGR